jgi:hypothetical protein
VRVALLDRGQDARDVVHRFMEESVNFSKSGRDRVYGKL